MVILQIRMQKLTQDFDVLQVSAAELVYLLIYSVLSRFFFQTEGQQRHPGHFYLVVQRSVRCQHTRVSIVQ